MPRNRQRQPYRGHGPVNTAVAAAPGQPGEIQLKAEAGKAVIQSWDKGQGSAILVSGLHFKGRKHSVQAASSLRVQGLPAHGTEGRSLLLILEQHQGRQCRQQYC